MAAAGASTGAAAEPDVLNSEAPTHLVYLVHGIWGFHWQWARFMRRLAAHPGAGAVLIHASAANSAFATGDGIDVCGRRAAEEVRRLVEAHPSLREVSFIGHSMGGLVARYAVGLLEGSPRADLADRVRRNGSPAGGGGGSRASGGGGRGPPGTLLRGRLAARAFVTIATPHLACVSPHPDEAGGGWASPLLIRALGVLAATGLVRFPSHDGAPASAAAAGAAAATAAGVDGPPAAAAAAAAALAPAPAPAAAGGVHPLLAGPHAAVANRSVAQLLGLDSAPLPGGAAAAGAEAAAGGAAAAAAAAGARAPLLDIMASDWEGEGAPAFLSGLAAFETRAVFSTAGGDHLINWASSSLRAAGELPPPPPRAWLARAPTVEEDGRPDGVAACSSGGGGGGDAKSAGAAAGGGAAPAGARCLGMRGRLESLRQLPWRRFDVAWPRWTPGPYHNSIFGHGPGGPVGEAVADAVAAVVLGAGAGRPGAGAEAGAALSRGGWRQAAL
ncbi:hypothetical protein Rsub_05334 [Raphidocelis subcapitata]|uniref:DUF676 domain-containing protein n=1 Tax=Raphidocelis subcapitata TaxID=307507 RepID=A0A2V0NX94_9CHLO|nr:hypothetical protein Rsub_05334 [Raphidocelis subcapitata]|eukprot:GBF92251.1 hypothetical protein Rsub_05334 [Raphidocelis subcapitata]